MIRFQQNFYKQIKYKYVFWLATGVLFCLSGVGFTLKAQTPPIKTANLTAAAEENYRIGPGDMIDIIVSKNETLSRTGVRVSNEGSVRLVMIDGDIQAACLTENELAEQVKGKYKKYLIDPHVIVAVREFNSTPVALIGAVNSPKQFQMQRPMRLLEVLALGSGPSEKSGSAVQIIRNPGIDKCRLNAQNAPAKTSEQILVFNLAETLKGSDQANPFIQPGDVVRVLEAEEVKKKQAYIIGNVKSAKTVDLNEPVTVTQAIAMAGGISEGAQIEKIRISRQVPGTLNKNEIFVNLKEINKRNQEDILLEHNDIVEVPGPSGSKKFLKDIFRTIVPSITRIGIPIP